MKLPAKRTVLGALLCFLCSWSMAQEAAEDSRPRFGGPNAVENQLDKDMESWNDWKKRLKDKHGFGFSIDYTGVVSMARGI